MSKRFEIQIAKEDEFYQVEITDKEGDISFFQCRNKSIEYIFGQVGKHFNFYFSIKEEAHGHDWNKVDGWDLWE